MFCKIKKKLDSYQSYHLIFQSVEKIYAIHNIYLLTSYLLKTKYLPEPNFILAEIPSIILFRPDITKIRYCYTKSKDTRYKNQSLM